MHVDGRIYHPNMDGTTFVLEANPADAKCWPKITSTNLLRLARVQRRPDFHPHLQTPLVRAKRDPGIPIPGKGARGCHFCGIVIALNAKYLA